MGNLGARRTARPSSSRRRCSTRRPRWRPWPSERCTSLYGVPTMFIAELGRRRLRRLRPVVAAHRDHGRVALPGRGHEAGHHRDAHGRGGHLLRHDRDVAGVHPDPRRRRPRAAHRDRRPGHAPRRGQGRSTPRPGLVVPVGDAGRAVHPGLLGDARLLGRARQDGRGHRRGPVDAHRRPGRHARRRLRQHRRAHQGPGHPGRREHLPARGRGVPLHPPRHRGRGGHRRARRALRRGAHGLDPAAARRRRPRRRGRAGLLRRAGSPTRRSPATCGSSTSSR